MVGFFPFLPTQALAMPPVAVALGSEKEKEKRYPKGDKENKGGDDNEGKCHRNA